jgi:hemoglobin
MRARVMAVVLLVMGTGAMTSRAEDRDKPAPALDRGDLDNRIVKTVYDATALGTEIYNKGNVEGCFRLYQGTLMAVQPLLKDYRVKLAQSVKDKMDRTKALSLVDGAFALRSALDEIQNEIAPVTKPDAKTDAKKTLWERLGGVAGVSKVVDQVFIMAVEDPKVKLFRDKKPDQKAINNLKQSLIEFISSVTGGPLPYKGKDMKAAHAGMKITDDEFNALAAIVEASLKKYAVPEPDIKEFMGLLETTRKDIVEVKGKN